MSRPVKASAPLSDNLRECMVKALGADKVEAETMNATADSFYSSQGRVNPEYFRDDNQTLMDDVAAAYPDVATMEMETFHLFDLARCSNKSAPIDAAAAVILVANRRTDEIATTEDMQHLQAVGGEAVIDALATYKLDESATMKGDQCVWN
eukprot:GFYU01017638.1.p1 GENE.GFYU01017638.1~~GFYU01017638.1.p1  ORF type:complete len:158 (+),score=47.52 GFYU01017638.1:23-475(+)